MWRGDSSHGFDERTGKGVALLELKWIRSVGPDDARRWLLVEAPVDLNPGGWTCCCHVPHRDLKRLGILR